MRHEINSWVDCAGNSYNVHKYESRDGCFHELHQVTDAEGHIKSVHKKKDQNGVVSIVEELVSRNCDN